MRLHASTRGKLAGACEPPTVRLSPCRKFYPGSFRPIGISYSCGFSWGCGELVTCQTWCGLISLAHVAPGDDATSRRQSQSRARDSDVFASSRNSFFIHTVSP